MSTVDWISRTSGSWDVASNWSTDTVPGHSDNAVINVPGVTVTISSKVESVNSITADDPLVISGGGLTVAALSTISGGLAMTGGTVMANGSGTSLTVTGTTTVSGASLYAEGGATLNLPNLASYTEPISFSTGTLEATGTGSVLSLPVLASITDTNGATLVEAPSGGDVEMPALSTSTGSDQLVSNSTSGTLNLSKLTTFTGGTLNDSGGNIEIPVLADVDSSTLLIGGGITLSLPDVTAASASSFEVSGGATLSLPKLASYTEPISFSTGTLEATGAGSVLSLPVLGSITDTNGATLVEALSGGDVEMPALSTSTGSDQVVSNSTGGTVNLSKLTTFTGGTLNDSGGNIEIPVLADVDSSTLLIGGGITLSLPDVTAASASSFEVSGGATLGLPNLASYTEPISFSTGTLEATGTGSVLSLPVLASITDTNGSTLVEALSGGDVEMPALSTSTGSDQVVSNSTGGTVNLSKLTTFTHGTLNDSGGNIEIPVLADVDSSTLLIGGGITLSLPHVTAASASSFEVSGGATLSLPNLASYTEPISFSTGTLEATGAGSVLSLPVLTSITDTNGGTLVEALSGGDVEMPALSTSTGSDQVVSNNTSGTLNLSKLTTFTGGTLNDSGGNFEIPVLADVDSSTLLIGGGITLSLPDVTAGTSSNLEVSGGATLSLLALAGYSNPNGFDTTNLEATGAGSTLKLPALASLGTLDSVLAIEALQGGQVLMPELAAITSASPYVQIESSGADSSINLTDLASFTGNSSYAELTITDGGALIDPNLTTFSNVTITTDTTGSFTVPSTQTFSFPSGTTTINTGTVLDQGDLSIQGNAIVNAQGGLTINSLGALSVSSKSTLDVSGNLLGNTTNAAAFSPQGTVTLDSAQGTTNPPQLLEAMSQDVGNVAAGFIDNFAYGTLELTANTYVEVVDDAPNSPGSAPQAIYVNTLIIPAGATLNLDGLNIYAQTKEVNGTIVNGGAIINGEVYDDVNDNGTLDSGEPGLAGWTVGLTNTSTGATDTTTTGANGLFSLTGITAGAYTLSQVTQPGFVQTQPASPGTYTITVTSGQTVNGEEFGDHATASISGVVFNDLNGDGRLESGEPGLAGWTVNLLNGSNQVIGTAATDSGGSYTFASLLPGTYTVEVVSQSGYDASSAASVTLTDDNGEADNVNFGEFVPIMVSGEVYSDATGAGLSGWTVDLVSGSRTLQTTSGSDGSFSFPGVGPGTFTVEAVQQTGYVASPGPVTKTPTSGTNISGLELGELQATAVSLAVSGLTTVPSSGLQSSESLVVEWSDTNTGTSAAIGSFYDRVVITNTTTGQQLASSFVEYNAATLGNLAAGASAPEQYDFTLPNGNAGVGQIQFTVTADYYGDVSTGQGGANNPASITETSTLAFYPDLATSDVSIVSTVSPGQQVSVGWTLANDGAATAAGPWTEQVLLATDAAGDNPILLTAHTFSGSLAAGQSVARSANVQVPEFAPGNYWFVVSENPFGQVYELNTTNNTAVAAQPTRLAGGLALKLASSTESDVAGPNATTATVTRNADTTGALVVSIANSDPNDVTVPQTVTIPAGATSVTFAVGTINNHVVEGTQTAALTASATGLVSGSATLTVTDTNVPTLTVVLNSHSVNETDPNPATYGTITSNDPMTIALTVSLLSSGINKLTVPATVTIPAGSTSATFPVTVVDDGQIDGNETVAITASDNGFQSGSDSAVVVDDIVPQLSLSLAETTVSEAAGADATTGTVSIVSPAIQPITIVLTSSDTSTATVPPSVLINAGQESTTFPIAAVNNGQDIGTQTATITASIESYAGVVLSQGSAQASLQLLNANGPALSVSLAAPTVYEGSSTTATVTRNTDTTDALVVTLSSSDPTEATVSSTVTIRAGQASVSFPVDSVQNGVPEGLEDVQISATATGLDTGLATLGITDVKQPDLVVSAVNAPTSGYDGSSLTISWTVTNTGQYPATGSWVDQIYLEQVGGPQATTPVDSLTFTGTVNAGQSYSETDTVPSPSTVGQYNVRVVTDAGQSIQELNYSDNTGVAAQPYNEQAAYAATAIPSASTVSPGTPVVLSGVAALTSDGAPAAGVPVAVGIQVAGTTRTLTATTDANGDYSVTFQPLPNEAGDYSVTAADPSVTNPAVQAQFQIVGMTAFPATASLTVVPGTLLSGSFTLTNLSALTLTGLSATSSGGPAGLEVELDAPSQIDAEGTATLDYTLDDTGTQAASGVVTIHVTSAQGVSLSILVGVSEAAFTPILATNPGYLDSGMVVGGETLVSFTLVNNGGAPSGDLQVSLPSTSYMSLATPATISSLAPGESSTVTIELTPSADLPLEEYQGTIGIGGAYAGISVPFAFTAVTTATGTVTVLVDDDYTFEEAGSPHVQGATVSLLKPYDNTDVVETGTTDASGGVAFTNVPAGTYDLQVTAPGHSNYDSAFTVLPGITNSDEVFIQNQFVSYTWNVVQTTIQNTYQIQLQTTFATDVPAPVVTINAPSTLPTLMSGQSATFNITLTNHGLIAAQDVTLELPTDADYSFTALSTDIGDLPAESSLVVPITVTDTDPPQNWVAPFSATDAAIDRNYDSTKSDYNDPDLLHQLYPLTAIPGAEQLGLYVSAIPTLTLAEGTLLVMGEPNAAQALSQFLSNTGAPLNYGQGTGQSNELQALLTTQIVSGTSQTIDQNLQTTLQKELNNNPVAQWQNLGLPVGAADLPTPIFGSDLGTMVGNGRLQSVRVTANGNVKNGTAYGTLTYQFVVEYGFGVNDATTGSPLRQAIGRDGRFAQLAGLAQPFTINITVVTTITPFPVSMGPQGCQPTCNLPVNVNYDWSCGRYLVSNTADASIGTNNSDCTAQSAESDWTSGTGGSAYTIAYASNCNPQINTVLQQSQQAYQTSVDPPVDTTPAVTGSDQAANAVGPTGNTTPLAFLATELGNLGLISGQGGNDGATTAQADQMVSTIATLDQLEADLAGIFATTSGQGASVGISGDIALLQQVNARLEAVTTAENLLFGGDANWLNTNQAVTLQQWLTAFFADAENSGDEGAITADQAAQLLATTLPSSLSTGEAMEFIDRWDRTVQYWSQGVFTSSQVPAGESTDFLDIGAIKSAFNAAVTAEQESQVDGYRDVGADAQAALAQVNQDLAGKGTCATVQLEIGQSLTLTGSAFDGTLTITNSEGTGAMTNVTMDIDITGSAGDPANGEFYVSSPTYSGAFSVINGVAALPDYSSGSIAFTFVPDNSAAADGPTQYDIGGTIGFTDPSGGAVTIPVFPAVITVYPQAQLQLNYFLQQYAIGQDSPSSQPEPAVLGLLVTNVGGGMANNLSIATAQPQIVQNAKGLLASFQIVGTQVGNESVTPSLTVDLGSVAPGQTADADFLIDSSLTGAFDNFTATYSNSNTSGASETSQIASVTTHTLIYAGDFNYPDSTGEMDYLAEDTPNADNLPDTIYFSDGTTAPVNIATDATATPVGPASALTYQVTANATSGWDYIQLPDPGAGYTLYKVVSSNGTVIPVNDQAWQTDVTVSPTGASTTDYELHIVDDNSTGSYTLYYRPTSPNAPTVASISSVTSPQSGPVGSVDITFSEPIDPSTFTNANLSLTLDGGANLIGSAVTITQDSPTTFTIGGLSAITGGDGNYTLTISAAGVSDFFGDIGTVSGSQSTSFATGTDVPVIVSVGVGNPSLTNTPVDTVDVVLSEPIVPSSFSFTALSLTLNGGPNLITSDVTVIKIDSTTYQIGGLAPLTGIDGNYVLTVAAAGLVDEAGHSGVGLLSESWTLNTVGPNVTSLPTYIQSPRNIVVPSIDVIFSEPIDPTTFTYKNIIYSKAGGPNLINSRITITEISPTEFEVSNFNNLILPIDGTYTFTVSAAGVMDLAGNTGSGSLSTSWDLETMAPAAPTGLAISPNTGASPGLTDTGLVTLTGTLSESGLAVDVMDGNTDLGFATVTGTSFSIALDLPAGANPLEVTADDAAGNVSPSTTFNVFVEQTSLEISSITEPAPNPRNTAVGSVDVTFNNPINATTFTTADLSLTDNGGPNLITSAVTISVVSGSTYQISGLAGVTTSNGNYTLTVNSSGIQDPYGNPGTNSLSTSWLMDTTPPTSTVNPLPTRETSLTFAVSVTGSDGGNPPSGVASYDIYASTNGGPWTLWTTVPVSSPTANFTGQSNTTYAFYSIARDLAGNTEVKSPLIEASTYVPDLTPPVTSVDGTTGSNPSTVNTSTGTFTLDLTGDDPGGSILEYFEVYVSVDGGSYQEVGPYAIPAGPADSSGNYHSTIIYQGLTDGQSHTYALYAIGLDAAGNLQSAPTSPNVTFSNQVFAVPGQLQVIGFTVEHGSPSRSFVRYLDIGLSESDSQSAGELTAIVNSINTSSPEIQIYKYDLNGDNAGNHSSQYAFSLKGVSFDVIDHAIDIDFGSGGIGGNPNTTAADGYYEVDIDLPNGQVSVHHFYRILGDVNGDGIVDANDLNEIAASINQTSQMGWTPLSADVNGDGSVTAFDLTLATRSKGRKLGSGLTLG